MRPQESRKPKGTPRNPPGDPTTPEETLRRPPGDPRRPLGILYFGVLRTIALRALWRLWLRRLLVEFPPSDVELMMMRFFRAGTRFSTYKLEVALAARNV